MFTNGSVPNSAVPVGFPEVLGSVALEANERLKALSRKSAELWVLSSIRGLNSISTRLTLS